MFGEMDNRNIQCILIRVSLVVVQLLKAARESMGSAYKPASAA